MTHTAPGPVRTIPRSVGTVTSAPPRDEPGGEDFASLVPVFVEHAACHPDDPRRAELRDRLVVSYLPVARNIARRFARRGAPPEASAEGPTARRENHLG